HRWPSEQLLRFLLATRSQFLLWSANPANHRTSLSSLGPLLESLICPLWLCRSFCQRRKHLLTKDRSTAWSQRRRKVCSRHKGACDRVQNFSAELVLALERFLVGSNIPGPKGRFASPQLPLCQKRSP